MNRIGFGHRPDAVRVFLHRDVVGIVGDHCGHPLGRLQRHDNSDIHASVVTVGMKSINLQRGQRFEQNIGDEPDAWLSIGPVALPVIYGI